MADQGEITRLLRGLGSDGRAIDGILPAVYDELRELARRRMRSERADHTLDPTDLVHEAYRRLSHLDRIEWKNRTHFFALAAQAMRRVLVDHALRRRTARRGGSRRRTPLDDAMLVSEQHADDVLALHEALTALEQLQPRLARTVECRYFAGYSVEETAEVLGVSPATVKRDWSVARAWLNRELSA
jgi:RNA polymerase sigma factor (TIGR02999 family)